MELTNGKFYVRKSHILSYNFCPLQFKKQYIDEVKQEESYSLTVGSRIHEFIQKFFYAIKKYDIHYSLWHSLNPFDVGSFEHKQAAYIISYQVDRMITEEVFYPAFTELNFSDHVKLISGTIDCAEYIDNSGSLRLVEWKSGKKFNSKDEILQLSFYAKALQCMLPDNPVKELRVVNTRIGEYMDYGEPNYDIVDQHIDKIKAAILSQDEIKPNCSPGKYPVCQLCKDTYEAGLYSKAPESLTL